MSYQRIVVSTGALVGAPGELPINLVGLDPDTLANLPAHLSPATLAQLDLADTGFLPVADPPPPPPPPPTVVPVLTFKRLLTAAERISIRTTANSNPTVADWLDILDTASDVYLTDADTVAGVQYMVSLGLLTADRAAMVLAATPPA